MRYVFDAEVWLHEGDSGWHFVTLPLDIADEIDERGDPVKRGFGSVRVHATVGTSRWSTSLFPDTKAESFVLPMKKPVRVAQGIEAGDVVTVELEIADLDL